MMCSASSWKGKSVANFFMSAISCIKLHSEALARAGSFIFSMATSAACHNESDCSRARSRRMPTVRSPMPRVGVLTTRSNAASSLGLDVMRK